MSPRVILITGTSSGVGRSLVEAALAKGEIVVATLRKPEALDDLKSKYTSEQLLVLPLDVTDLGQVKAAFATAKETFGRLDVVVNNAGTTLIGELETTTDEQARALFETNFFGPMAITREAVALFRKQGSGGHIIQNTSSSATKALAASSIYSATKAGLEALSDAVRDELDPAWGIKVTTVQLGATRTSIGEKGTFAARDPAYEAVPSLPQNNMIAAFLSGQFRMADPDKAARAILDTLDLPAEERPQRVILGADTLGFVEERARILKDLVEHDREVAVSIM
ncbi:hypothetical protein JCM10207_005325 [Rhodosporidiobolus poonsookiae]